MTPGTTASRQPRLAIVLSHATQYYSPWFRWLRANTGLEFRVFYLSDFGLRASHDEKFGRAFAWDTDLTSGYDWEIVPNTARTPDTLRFGGLRNPELPARLVAWRPDAILLFGYNYNTHLRLVAWARLKGIPLIFRGDSHLLGRARLPLIRRLLLHLLYRQFSAVTFVGAANREYFAHLGVPDSRLFFAPHAVDDTLFSTANSAHQARAAALRAGLGFGPSTQVVLFSAKLIAAKQPAALLDAYLSLPYGDHALVIAGDGSEKASLEKTAASHPDARVRFLPFANQSEMPSRYLLADLFGLPSRGAYETWGLAVNEAMHMGVPCLVSSHVGCQRDLVTDGETGWVFDANHPDQLRDKLAEALAALRANAPAIRAAVAARISRYTYAQASQGLLEALSAAVINKR